MESQSNVLPGKIWIKKVEGGIATVRLTRNIATAVNEEETVYSYEEVETTIVDRENLEGYIEEWFDVLFDGALSEENKPKPLTSEEKVRIEMARGNAEMLEMVIMLTGGGL